MFRRIVLLTVIVLLVFSTGCTRRITDFTVISTKNVEADWQTSSERVVGKHCIPVIIFPWGVPNLKEAIDDAIEQAGPGYDALIDGVVYYKNKSFLVGSICYEVEGTPVNSKEQSGMNLGPRDGNLLYHSSVGEVNDLSEVEFIERSSD